MKSTIEEALARGLKSYQAGNFVEAQHCYREIIELNASHPVANHNLGIIEARFGKFEYALELFQIAIAAKPAEEQFWLDYIKMLIKMKRYSEAREKLIEASNNGLSDKNKNLIEKRLNENHREKRGQECLLGKIISAFNENRVDDAFQQCVSLLASCPNEPDALNVMGAIKFRLGENETAIVNFKRALLLKNNLAEVHNNLGLAVGKSIDGKEALSHFKRSITLKPCFIEAYNNLAKTYQTVGKIREALCNYNRIGLLDKNLTGAKEAFYSLLTQTGNYFEKRLFLQGLYSLEKEALLTPVLACTNLINSFIEGDFRTVKDIISKKAQTLKQSNLSSLTVKNKTFCIAYFELIEKLLKHELGYAKKSKPCAFHIGDSHCLAFAHRSIIIGDRLYNISPKIILGAKAFHLSSNVDLKYKSIFSLHANEIPEKSHIFLSFGEIDCRENEGILSAWKKGETTLDETINQTVNGYFEFVVQVFEKRNCCLYFMAVPAPVSQDNIIGGDKFEEKQLVDIIQKFNARLSFLVSKTGYKFIDVYKLTRNLEGLSNNKYHIDRRHLSPKILCQIERLIDFE